MQYLVLLILSVFMKALKTLWKNPFMWCWILLCAGPWIFGAHPLFMAAAPTILQRIYACLIVVPVAYIVGSLLSSMSAVANRSNW